ncbi:hypothetical protein N7463_001279 [Penicillium fimorum]|uniref:Uncharacterized protein n=1 Tax=Penicillium fimorum TaxID=1882269 RepID=A0A9X0CBP5_9EURO|nr:hypothetical protein N7463_001279 [Penicillium fimorum]
MSAHVPLLCSSVRTHRTFDWFLMRTMEASPKKSLLMETLPITTRLPLAVIQPVRTNIRHTD